MHHFWPISLNVAMFGLTFLWLSWIPSPWVSLDSVTSPQPLSLTPGDCLRTSYWSPCFALFSLISWTIVNDCPVQVWMFYALPDQGDIPLNAWKLKQRVRCLLEKKKIEIKKKKKSNRGLKVLHCLAISASVSSKVVLERKQVFSEEFRSQNRTQGN